MKDRPKTPAQRDKPARLRLSEMQKDPRKLRALLETTNRVQIMDGRRVVMDYGIYGGPNGLEVD